MQNTSQTFRGSAAPGVNYSENSYDNHLGGNHCQSPGYQHQSYTNQVYQPRPHHYGNHQMQQNMSYRHHGGGGSYVPNQNQYGPHMNQDMYRNHHPGYTGPNNRNLPVKTWTENSGDLMPPYGQGSPHSQMMNNPPPSQMPVNTMRSPSHVASNMQPSPQGQQHYGSIHSPVHSPHSWSQAQIPSPGMMHSSRTSPAHVRSPGHSQPFSPSSAHSMNLQTHHQPQENGQMSQSMGSASGSDNPSNPLHSLQKMVLLDQDPMSLSTDGSDQFSNQCGPHAYGPVEECSNEPKDSQYATYYNMDENRFESKPNIATNDTPIYVPMQQPTNCNYPTQPHSAGVASALPDTVNSNVTENYHMNHNQNPMHPQINSNIEQSHCKSNTPQIDCSSKQNDCPPHAESAPVFSDQTQAAVSTNSEQALQSKSKESMSVMSNISDPENASIAQMSQSDTAGTPCPSASETLSSVPVSSDLNPQCVNKESDHSFVNSSSSLISDCSSSKSTESENKVHTNPSINTPSSLSQDCDSNMTSTDSKLSNNEESQSSDKKISSCENSKEAALPASEPKTVSHKADPKKYILNQSELESNCTRNPVKVVIHRIRKNDADDTWHVPGSSEKPIKTDDGNGNNPSGSSTIPFKSPQIIMLSQETSNPSQNSVSTTGANSNESDDVCIIDVKGEPGSSPTKSSSSYDRKRPGRPVGSRNRTRTPRDGKNKRGKKGQKRRGKIDNSKIKIPDSASKIKKISKNFSGPYVRVTGTKDNPSSISVVNVAQKEEEKISKPLLKRVSTAMSRIKSKTVGHLSTLSPTYDAFNRDKTWVCVFCQKGSHHGGLGDLYGPYYIKDNSDSKLSPSTSSATNTPKRASNKRKKSEADDSKGSKRSKQSSTTSTPKNRQKPNNKTGDGAEESTKEVWIHEDCAIWCQSITMLGEEVGGLEEAVAEANENKCNKCALQGATVGCWGKGCKEMYHYSCAKTIGCQLDIEKFSLLCLKHKKNSNKCQ